MCSCSAFHQQTVTWTTLDGLKIGWHCHSLPQLTESYQTSAYFVHPVLLTSSIMDDHVFHSFQKLYQNIHLSKMIPNGTKLEMHDKACISLMMSLVTPLSIYLQENFISKPQCMEITFVYVDRRFIRTCTKSHHWLVAAFYGSVQYE